MKVEWLELEKDVGLGDISHEFLYLEKIFDDERDALNAQPEPFAHLKVLSIHAMCPLNSLRGLLALTPALEVRAAGRTSSRGKPGQGPAADCSTRPPPKALILMNAVVHEFRDFRHLSPCTKLKVRSAGKMERGSVEPRRLLSVMHDTSLLIRGLGAADPCAWLCPHAQLYIYRVRDDLLTPFLICAPYTECADFCPPPSSPIPHPPLFTSFRLASAEGLLQFSEISKILKHLVYVVESALHGHDVPHFKPAGACYPAYLSWDFRHRQSDMTLRSFLPRLKKLKALSLGEVDLEDGYMEFLQVCDLLTSCDFVCCIPWTCLPRASFFLKRKTFTHSWFLSPSCISTQHLPRLEELRLTVSEDAWRSWVADGSLAPLAALKELRTLEISLAPSQLGNALPQLGGTMELGWVKS